MSAVGIEHIDENTYKVCRFQYKSQRDVWVSQQPNYRKAASRLDRYLTNKARKLMSSSGNECLKITDTRKKK